MAVERGRKDLGRRDRVVGKKIEAQVQDIKLVPCGDISMIYEELNN